MLKIRLRRMGSRHRPFYRVVVSDSRRTPTSTALEEIGFYDPRKKPTRLELDMERVDHWLSRGAQPSETLGKLISKLRRGKLGQDLGAEPVAAEKTDEKAEAAPDKADAKAEKKADAKAEKADAKAEKEAAAKKTEEKAEAASEESDEKAEAAADEGAAEEAKEAAAEEAKEAAAESADEGEKAADEASEEAAEGDDAEKKGA